MNDVRPLHGRKLGDRRVVVDRPHARYFRYIAPGVLEAKLEAQAPRTAYQRRMATICGLHVRSPALVGRGPYRAASHLEGPARLLVRRDVVGGLRDRGDDADPGRRRAGPIPVRARSVGRGRGPSGHRYLQLSPNDPGISQRRRKLHRRPRQSGRPGRPGGGRILVDGLRPDGVRERFVGRPGSVFRLPGDPISGRSTHRPVDPAGHGREICAACERAAPCSRAPPTYSSAPCCCS